ncbi:MAG: hypothetical protein JWM11_956 [Planctomycetaceae bacterium]|nr:hypothetical protein [Planctomycetaceae bacterium]
MILDGLFEIVLKVTARQVVCQPPVPPLEIHFLVRYPLVAVAILMQDCNFVHNARMRVLCEIVEFV